MYNMKATEIFRRRIVYTEISFAEIVLWKVPIPLSGSTHSYKYRLSYIVNGICVLRYDNEAGKGDHRHFGKTEEVYRFDRPEVLISDFQQDIARWNHENSNA